MNVRGLRIEKMVVKYGNQHRNFLLSHFSGGNAGCFCIILSLLHRDVWHFAFLRVLSLHYGAFPPLSPSPYIGDYKFLKLNSLVTKKLFWCLLSVSSDPRIGKRQIRGKEQKEQKTKWEETVRQTDR